MGVVLAPVLGWIYALRSGNNPWLASIAMLLAYAVALPPFSGNVLDYLRAVGPSGLFMALLFGAYRWREAAS